MKRIISLFLALVVMLTTFALPTFAQEDGDGTIRFVHVIPGAPAIDVYVNGMLTLRALDYGSVSSDVRAPDGQHTLTVTAAGEADPLWTQDVIIESGLDLTLVAASASAPIFTVYPEERTPLALGEARITAIHAIDGAPAIDVLLSDGRPVVSSLAYGLPYGTLDIGAEAVSLVVTTAGAALSEALVPATDYGLDSGTLNTLLVYGTLDAPMAMLIKSSVQGEGETGLARFVHGVSGASAVNVFVNNLPVAPILAYPNSTEYIALPVGEHTVSVRLPDSDEDLLSGAIEVEAGGLVTAIVTGQGADLRLDVYPDTLTGIDANTAQVSGLNTLPTGAGLSIAVQSADDAAPRYLFENVGANEFGGITVDPQAADFVVTVTQDGDTVPYVFEMPSGIYGGVYYTFATAQTVSGDIEVIMLPPYALAQTVGSAAPGGEMLAATTATPMVQFIIVTATTPPTSGAAVIPTVPAVDIVTVTPALTGDGAALQATTSPIIEVAPVTPVPGAPSVTDTPVPAPAALFPSARVQLNPGANLQLRQYPNTRALSLGLAPSGSTLQVNGRAGEPGPVPLPIGVTPTPDLTSTPFIDPVALITPPGDLDPLTTWLNVVYNTPDGGTITAWVNAGFVVVTSTTGRSQRLADLPTVPSNRAGQAQNTAVTPPTARENVIEAVVTNVSPGVNVHIRRIPQTEGESLVLLANGTIVDALGINETGDWVFVRATQPDGGTVSGWANLEYLTFTLNDQPTTLEALQERQFIGITAETERGEVIAGTIPPTSAANPFVDAIVAEVVLDPGAALHLRRNPNVNAESLALLPSGTRVAVTLQTPAGDWLRANFDGQIGWISARYVRLTFNNEPFDLADVPVDTSFGTAVPTLEGTPGLIATPGAGIPLPPGAPPGAVPAPTLVPGTDPDENG